MTRVCVAAIALAVASCLVTSEALAVRGQTIDFASAKSDLARRERRMRGRAYLHPSIVDHPNDAFPVVVFMHGLNRDHLPYRWMGATQDPDVRALMDTLIDDRVVQPAVLVAPMITDDCDFPRAMWPAFDLDRFLALAFSELSGRIRLDRSNIIFAGHSGAGCNTSGGMMYALRQAIDVRAVLVIDTCMDIPAAPAFALTPPDVDLVITYQPRGWERPFDDFEKRFQLEAPLYHPTGLRIVEKNDLDVPSPHAAMVEHSFRKWLPKWLAPKAPSAESH